MKETQSSEENISGFMRLPQVLEIIPIGRSTWWLWVQRGIAPKPVQLAIRTTAWRRDDIRKLIIEMEKEDWVKNYSERMNNNGSQNLYY